MVETSLPTLTRRRSASESFGPEVIATPHQGSRRSGPREGVLAALALDTRRRRGRNLGALFRTGPLWRDGWTPSYPPSLLRPRASASQLPSAFRQ